jgi:hypothetical protein
MLKILFLDTEEGILYAYEESSILDGCVTLELVDKHGNSLDGGEEFALHEIGEALVQIGDLVEACHDS